ncbi:MAG: EAL domain-containing protein, partial [Actinomycetota bacterium]|nr:EAL domain-containing protein [Actinomycetota bacterium]
DPLTGMPNRELLGRRLSEALAAAGGAPGTVGVLFCDLDGFKVVNDSLGHAAGDRLLVSVAGRFAQHVRGTDLAARLGGDEFAVLVPQVSEPEALEALARRLLDGLSEPFVVDRRRLIVTASVGIATNAEGGEQPGDLLRDADLAMYAAKRRGPGELAWFQAAMRNSALARLELESDLRTALAHRRLVMHYQPIADLASGRLVGSEAQVRWHHPQRGLLVAADFVSVVEETGLIGDLGRQVLQQACRHVRALPDPAGESHTVSVSVSIRQLTQRGFAADVREALERAGLPASRLVVEFSESDLMNCPVEALNVLDALRALGVRVAIDRTGYSSPGQLRRLPVDILKVDRSFVSELEDGDQLAYVEAVVRLGQTLGLKVLAEGVDSAGQRDQLLGMGCEQGQGPFFGLPMEPAAHRRLVEAAAPAVGRVG